MTTHSFAGQWEIVFDSPDSPPRVIVNGMELPGTMGIALHYDAHSSIPDLRKARVYIDIAPAQLRIAGTAPEDLPILVTEKKHKRTLDERRRASMGDDGEEEAA